MKSIIFLVLLACFASLALSAATIYQITDSDMASFLVAHNLARDSDALNPTPAVPLTNYTWNTTLQLQAQEFLSTCPDGHSTLGYGENIYYATQVGVDTWVGQAVSSWVGEKDNYDYANNMCVATTECLHYTQVIWADSIQIGCARIDGCASNAVIIICEYSPAGNVQDQRPYVAAEDTTTVIATTAEATTEANVTTPAVTTPVIASTTVAAATTTVINTPIPTSTFAVTTTPSSASASLSKAAVSPSPSGSKSRSPSTSRTPSISSSGSKSRSKSISKTSSTSVAAASPSASKSKSVTSSKSRSNTPSISASSTKALSPSNSKTGTRTPTPTVSKTSSPSSSKSKGATASPSPSKSKSNTPSQTVPASQSRRETQPPTKSNSPSLGSCGDGRLTAGEVCDPSIDDRCCNAGCAFKAGGKSCGTAPGVCFKAPTCDGQGVCGTAAFKTGACKVNPSDQTDTGTCSSGVCVPN